MEAVFQIVTLPKVFEWAENAPILDNDVKSEEEGEKFYYSQWILSQSSILNLKLSLRGFGVLGFWEAEKE